MLKPCEQWNMRLSAYLDGEGNENERGQVETHLKECSACRTAAEIARCDAQDVAATLTARKAGDNFAAQVMARVAVTAIEDRGLEPKPKPKPAPKPISFGRRLMEWGLVLCVLAIFSSILFPVFAKPREKSRQTTCLSQVRQIATALQMYAQDNHGYLPKAENWIEAVTSYLGDSKKMLLCPSDGANYHEETISYQYNSSLSGVNVNTIISSTETPIVWCLGRHSGGSMIGFADGHVKYYPGVKTIGDYVALQRKDFEAANERAKAIGEPAQPAPVIPVPGSEKRPTITPPARNYGLAEKLQIAYQASLSLRSADVQASMEQAELLFLRYDGFVLKSDYQRGEDDVATATVSGRVPSTKLGTLLIELDRLGTVQARTVNGEDLTAAHIDQIEKLSDLGDTQRNLEHIETRSRPTTAMSAESERHGAASLASGVRVEQYRLKSRVALAEVTVQIASLPKPPAPAVNPVISSASKSFGALRAFGLWLFTGLVIPLGIWLPVWGPLVALGILLRRRYRMRE